MHLFQISLQLLLSRHVGWSAGDTLIIVRHRHEAKRYYSLGDRGKAQLLVVSVPRVWHKDRQRHFFSLLHSSILVLELEHSRIR